ncbi:endolytic transglycosylase MltG [Aquimarina addita]|uniref:Endolytic murein transglycosylase n=1 Tax=Aquimarina addita TaxID=870485 RepID=A0ABP6UTE9_9FLAO
MSPKKKKKSVKKKSSGILKKILGFLVLCGCIVGGYVGYLYYTNFMKANVDTKGEEVYLMIPRNANTEQVLTLINELDIIIDESSLIWMAEKKNYKGRNIVAGKYRIKDGLSNNSLINHLRAGNGKLDMTITFNQVRDLKQLSGAITRGIMLDSLDVYNWLSNKDSIRKYGFNENTIISMFIPNTYNVDWDVTASELMARMAKEYKDFWNEERIKKSKALKLSQSEITTLASVVYWETKKPKDMRTVAGVYLNRLRIGMPLQADPTLIFALGDYTIRRVLDKHKEIDSPYNTYKYNGLPPGPIIIPPISYIDAVLNYEKHDYLYFVAKEDFSGDSYFAKTYSQHLIYARRYQNALNKRNVYR